MIIDIEHLNCFAGGWLRRTILCFTFTRRVVCEELLTVERPHRAFPSLNYKFNVSKFDLRGKLNSIWFLFLCCSFRTISLHRDTIFMEHMYIECLTMPANHNQS